MASSDNCYDFKNNKLLFLKLIIYLYCLFKNRFRYLEYFSELEHHNMLYKYDVNTIHHL